MESITSNDTLAAAAILLATFLFFLYHNRKHPLAPPEAGGAWPLIGHLHLLGGPQPPHITLGNMAEKHGPIFTIKLGVHRALIISNSDLAQECLTTHDQAFANRPTALATEILGYNHTLLGFSRYGPLWRTLRKISAQDLLSSRRVDTIRTVRASEVDLAIKDIHDRCRAAPDNVTAVEMKKWFGDVTLNVICRFVIGRPLIIGTTDKAGEVCQQAFRDYLELAGRFVVADSLPYLRWLDIGGYEKAMKKTMKEIDGVLQTWLEEHKEKRSFVSKEDRRDGDFMDSMLDVIEGRVHEELSGHDGDKLIKANCLGLMLAASDTTALTMTWALSLLLNNPHKLKKCQQELHNQVGNARHVQDTDMKTLVYLEAVLKETMRLYPVAPLLLPHESREDRVVEGYRVPAGTRVMFNAWKIHRDPEKWPSPAGFDPDKFLGTHKDVEVGGKCFELIPFGSGRRMCPGSNFAMEVMRFALASLLHEFEVSNPSSEPVDMREGSGLTNVKVAPLGVLFKPRLGMER